MKYKFRFIIILYLKGTNFKKWLVARWRKCLYEIGRNPKQNPWFMKMFKWRRKSSYLKKTPPKINWKYGKDLFQQAQAKNRNWNFWFPVVEYALTQPNILGGQTHAFNYANKRWLQIRKKTKAESLIHYNVQMEKEIFLSSNL